MADWQVELETLLSELQVTLDHDSPRDERPSHVDTRASRLPMEEKGDAHGLPGEHEDDADIPWELGPLMAEEPPAEDDDVSAVRSEIEATVGQVIALARAGRIDRDLRDDIVFVLQALTRPHPAPPLQSTGLSAHEDARQEWQIASAAAVLRFCRIVLRLTHALAPDTDMPDTEELD